MITSDRLRFSPRSRERSSLFLAPNNNNNSSHSRKPMKKEENDGSLTSITDRMEEDPKVMDEVVVVAPPPPQPSSSPQGYKFASPKSPVRSKSRSQSRRLFGFKSATAAGNNNNKSGAQKLSSFLEANNAPRQRGLNRSGSRSLSDLRSTKSVMTSRTEVANKDNNNNSTRSGRRSRYLELKRGSERSERSSLAPGSTTRHPASPTRRALSNLVDRRSVFRKDSKEMEALVSTRFLHRATSELMDEYEKIMQDCQEEDDNHDVSASSMNDAVMITEASDSSSQYHSPRKQRRPMSPRRAKLSRQTGLFAPSPSSSPTESKKISHRPTPNRHSSLTMISSPPLVDKEVSSSPARVSSALALPLEMLAEYDRILEDFEGNNNKDIGSAASPPPQDYTKEGGSGEAATTLPQQVSA